jgi:hypothetical protein
MPKNTSPNFTTAPIELISDPALTPYDKVVWQCIRFRQGQNSHAWPSEETIAKDAGGISIISVKRSIKRLQKAEWLKVEKPPNQGRGQTNRYSIIANKKGILKRRGRVSQRDTNYIKGTIYTLLMFSGNHTPGK